MMKKCSRRRPPVQGEEASSERSVRRVRLHSRPSVGGLQWIQYQLDIADSVPAVLASDSHIRIATAVPLHYLVADAEGNVAAVEFLQGRMVAHTGFQIFARAVIPTIEHSEAPPGWDSEAPPVEETAIPPAEDSEIPAEE